jgi:hypothetical protein
VSFFRCCFQSGFSVILVDRFRFFFERVKIIGFAETVYSDGLTTTGAMQIRFQDWNFYSFLPLLKNPLRYNTLLFFCMRHSHLLDATLQIDRLETLQPWYVFCCCCHRSFSYDVLRIQLSNLFFVF